MGLDEHLLLYYVGKQEDDKAPKGYLILANCVYCNTTKVVTDDYEKLEDRILRLDVYNPETKRITSSHRAMYKKR